MMKKERVEGWKNEKSGVLLLTSGAYNNIIIRRCIMEIIRQINSDTLVLNDLKSFLGKKVKINIDVIDTPGQNNRMPKPLGKYKLGKELDDINIRDFAHEEN